MKNSTQSFLATLGLGILLAPAALAQQTIGSTTPPGSTLDVRGSVGANYQQVTASSYGMTATDYYVVYNGTAAGTITLPAAGSGSGALAASFKGRLYTIKNTTAAQTLTVTPAGSETIDGSATITVPAGQSVQLVSTGGTSGATWEIVAFAAATSGGAGAGVTASNGLTATSGNVTLGGTLTRATDVATAGNNLTFSGTGNVGIGTASPAFPFQVATNTNSLALASFDRYATSGGWSLLGLRTATGTQAAPQAVPAGRFVGQLTFQGYNGSAFAGGASILATATEDQAASASGTSLAFQTTANGTTNPVNRMFVSQNGNVGIGTNTPLAPLHVVASGSSSALTTSFLTPGVVLTGPSTVSGLAGPGLYFEGLGNPTGQRVMKLNLTSNGTSGFLNFQAVSDDATTSIRSVMAVLPAGNVGIGTTAPGTNLHVVNQGTGGAGVFSTNTTNIGLRLENTGNGQAIIQQLLAKDASGNAKQAIIGINPTVPTTGGNGVLLISRTGDNDLSVNMTNGFVGVGTITSAYRLDVSGDINASGSVRSNGTALTSDRRLKRNIAPVGHGLSTVMQLRPVQYDKKATIESTDYARHELGFIAQDLQQLLPSLVSEGRDAHKTLAVSYTELIPVLTKALQEQQAQIDALQAANTKLQAQADGTTKAQAELQDVKASLQSLAEQVKLLQAGGATATTK